MKPAEVIKARNFKMTSRVGEVRLSKSLKRWQNEDEEDRKKAHQTIAALQNLRQKELDLKREEDLIRKRKEIMQRSASGGTGWRRTRDELRDQQVLELIEMQQSANEKDAMIKIEAE